MATALRPRRPLPSLGLPFLYPPPCLAALRQPFSTSPLLGRQSTKQQTRSERMERQAIKKQERAQQSSMPSLSALQRQQMREIDLEGRDIGLLPDTFIMPTGRNKPALTRWPRARLRMEWARLKARARDYFYVMAGKWSVIKPRPKLHTRRLPRIAQALQARMYTAFAEADEVTINDTCCTGLAQSFTHRLARRGPRERWTWTLLRYRGRPRVVSHKIAAMPTGEKGRYMAIRQAVVRVRSEQSLSKGDAAPEPREVTEYLVLQQTASPGTTLNPEWRVWGTLEEDPDLWKKYI